MLLSTNQQSQYRPILKYYSTVNKHINTEMESLERELSTESLRDKQELEERHNKEREEALQSAEEREKEIMESNIDEDERERLLKEHRDNVEKMNVSWDIIVFLRI